MKLGWLSDIHLPFASAPRRELFHAELAAAGADAWLLGGDIAEADTVVEQLDHLADAVGTLVYFVLGNHDFYGSSLARVTREVRQQCASDPRLVWLTHAGHLSLGGGTALVGEDGWGDPRLGNAATSPVMLNDFFLIRELLAPSRADLMRTLNRLGDEAAARLSPKLSAAAAGHRHVIVLTHVPPFRESAWHEGRPSDDDWLPWFTCKAVGDALLACAAAHPRVRFLVLCGHTHGAGEWHAAENVEVVTGGAVYGAPVVQRVIDVGGA